MNNYSSIYVNAREIEPPWHILIQWPWWYGDFRGLTLGPLIFVKDKGNIPVIIHELVHVAQFYRQPFTFFIRYLLELKKNGYWNNKYEIEARVIQKKAEELIEGLK